MANDLEDDIILFDGMEFRRSELVAFRAALRSEDMGPLKRILTNDRDVADQKARPRIGTGDLLAGLAANVQWGGQADAYENILNLPAFLDEALLPPEAA